MSFSNLNSAHYYLQMKDSSIGWVYVVERSEKLAVFHVVLQNVSTRITHQESTVIAIQSQSRNGIAPIVGSLIFIPVIRKFTFECYY